VADATYVLFGWQRNLSDEDVDALLDDWLPRVSSERDYGALIDWFNLWLHGQKAVPERLRERALRLLMLRRQHPDIAREAWDWCRIADGLADEHGAELARLVFDLVDSGSLMIHEGRDESEVITPIACLYPQAVWDDIAGRLEQGSWRIQMEIRGWLLTVVPLQVIEAWVGDDVRRARLIASIAPIGGEEPTPVVRFLLERFGEDKEVRSSLWAQFISGFWIGPESDRLAGPGLWRSCVVPVSTEGAEGGEGRLGRERGGGAHRCWPSSGYQMGHNASRRVPRLHWKASACRTAMRWVVTVRAERTSAYRCRSKERRRGWWPDVHEQEDQAWETLFIRYTAHRTGPRRTTTAFPLVSLMLGATGFEPVTSSSAGSVRCVPSTQAASPWCGCATITP
jgi:hypothetical protein